MKKLLPCIVLSCLMATPAMSQPSRRDRHKSPDMTFQLALAAYNGAVMADTVTTLKLLQRPGTREANPILEPFEDRQMGLAIARAAAGVGANWVLIKLHERHRKLGLWVTLVATGVNTAVAIHNFRKLK